MKFALSLVLCLIVAASAERIRSPEFVIRDGFLVRKGTPETSALPVPRLVGGGDAEPNSAPWIISLQWGTIRPGHFCGGALIAPNWILTAAHCSSSYPNFGISTVVSGLHNLNNFMGEEQIRQVNLNQIFAHEDWTGFVGPHDVSLILVSDPFVEDFSVRPIALPAADALPTGNVRLHGWGSTSTGFIPVWPTILQTVEKPLITVAQCSPLFDGVVVDNNNLCTGPLTGGASACSGDSGSPLTQNNVLVGIFSHTQVPCGQPNRPSVYVRVSAYVSWINDIIDDN
ncbi:anionic trypsin-like [Bradysia coprophila]|uniref:anionic trypsin-like n=1 Tax=Bradysia coprophila TaxID=38358 RepID=UPI00187DB89A|nr:anionic trypsin-like [Bradysia coprophila]